MTQIEKVYWDYLEHIRREHPVLYERYKEMIFGRWAT